MFNESNTIGDLTEIMFDLIAISKGWYVGYPYNNTMPYDRVVSMDNGNDWSKIQIKTAEFNGSSYRIDVQTKNGESYCDTCDYMVASADNRFFMFPVSELMNVTTKYSFKIDESKPFFIGGVVINNELW